MKDGDKEQIVPAARMLSEAGFAIVATGGTADYLDRAGVTVEKINKVAQGRPHIVDRIKDGGITLIFNTTEGWQSLKDSKPIREAALGQKIPTSPPRPPASRRRRRLRRRRAVVLKYVPCNPTIRVRTTDPDMRT